MNDKSFNEAQRQYDSELPEDIEYQLAEEERQAAYLEWLEDRDINSSNDTAGKISSDIDKFLEGKIEE